MSFFQFGEDLILDALFERRGIKSGTYIEAGAFDPIKLSNTSFFYKKGWRGICIEPNPQSFRKLCKRWPADIYLNVAVSNLEGEVSFVCDEAKSGIFNKNYLFPRQDQKAITVPALKLNNILEKYLNYKQINEFISVKDYYFYSRSAVTAFYTEKSFWMLCD